MANYKDNHGTEYDRMLSKFGKKRLIQMYKNAVMEREELRKQIADMTIDSIDSVKLNRLIKKDE